MSTTEAPGLADPRLGDGRRAGRIGRASQGIVDGIRILTRDGRLKPGDRLPAEHELCRRFGVGRVTLREALRVLETNGLVTVRVGGRGGVFVADPSDERMGAGVAALISDGGLVVADVAAASLVIEVGILPLVIDRATDEDTGALMTMVEACRSGAAPRDGSDAAGMCAAFHIRLAECTRNPVIGAFVRGFYGSFAGPHTRTRVSTAGRGRSRLDRHAELVRAIKDRDVCAAEEAMRRHLRCVS